MRVLVACEESQVVCKEFRKLGHEAYSCDIQDCSGGHPEWHIKGDVLGILDNGWDLMIAHPCCRRLTNAGARWLHKPPNGKTLDQIWGELAEAVEFYKAIRNAPIAKKAIENPIMHRAARAFLGFPKRQVVQPWYFGERAFKATGFELHNLSELQPTHILTPPEKGTDEHKAWSFIHRMPPSPEREKMRSKTFHGIAEAMAQQWGGQT